MIYCPGGGISASPLPFLAMTPLGILELIGLVGMVWWRGRVEWGKPLLLMTGSAYTYWLICLAGFTVSGHTALLQDTPRMIEPLLATSGFLTIVQVSPGIVGRLALGTVPRPADGRSVLARRMDCRGIVAGLDARRSPGRGAGCIGPP